MKIGNVALGGMNNYGSRLCDWLEERRPDIVTIQKIGLDKDFRKHEEELRKLGYNSMIRGARAGNYPLGVAVLSCRKLPEPEEIPGELPCNGGKSRFLAERIGDFSVCAVYVPPSSSKDGPTVDWLDCLRVHVGKEGYAQRKSVLCGDFNVPKIDDKSKGTLKLALKELKSLGFLDLYREKHPNEKGDTSGCGHRYPSRLHLILASESLVRCCRSVWLDDNPALWPRADAPPLIAELDFEP